MHVGGDKKVKGGGRSQECGGGGWNSRIWPHLLLLVEMER